MLGRGGINVSADYRLNPGNLDALRGWTDSKVAERQHAAIAPLVVQARNGNPRRDFSVAADAIAVTGETNPLIVEVGCGSGYYSDVLPVLLGHQIRYVGIDYSSAMTTLARQSFPDQTFVTGDALALPFATGSCDISMSGTSLMHIPDFRTAIQEMVRVSKRWCVFHTVPVITHGRTMVLSKLAYGERVAEIIFNRDELEALFSAAGLVIRDCRPSFPYDVSRIVGEPTTTLTYCCEKAQ